AAVLEREDDDRGAQAISVQAMPPVVHVQVLQPSGDLNRSPITCPSSHRFTVVSFRHWLEHPSPFLRFPSSQVSRYSILPLPHQCVRRYPNPAADVIASTAVLATRESPAMISIGSQKPGSVRVAIGMEEELLA
ncbi:MAG TPA: hypothetical protein VI873_04055, partial [Candidatus Peribacteraceae bacterium]|nr:hypothetical protein [Candidatus Peribacteraceae bacterium]